MEELNRVTYVIASPSLACICLCGHVTPLPRLTPMDPTFADAIILDALSHDPERVRDAVAKVAREFVESGRYSAEEVTAAVDELRDELEGHLQPLPLVIVFAVLLRGAGVLGVLHGYLSVAACWLVPCARKASPPEPFGHSPQAAPDRHLPSGTMARFLPSSHDRCGWRIFPTPNLTPAGLAAS